MNNMNNVEYRRIMLNIVEWPQEAKRNLMTCSLFCQLVQLSFFRVANVEKPRELEITCVGTFLCPVGGDLRSWNSCVQELFFSYLVCYKF